MAKKIRQAILQIQAGHVDRKMGVYAVAELAGTSGSNIYNNYPDLAEHIQQIKNKTSRAQRDEKNAELKKQRAKNTALRKELVQARELNRDMASEMATLAAENERLNAIAESKKVVVFPSKKS